MYVAIKILLPLMVFFHFVAKPSFQQQIGEWKLAKFELLNINVTSVNILESSTEKR